MVTAGPEGAPRERLEEEKRERGDQKQILKDSRGQTRMLHTGRQRWEVEAGPGQRWPHPS